MQVDEQLLRRSIGQRVAARFIEHADTVDAKIAGRSGARGRPGTRLGRRHGFGFGLRARRHGLRGSARGARCGSLHFHRIAGWRCKLATAREGPKEEERAQITQPFPSPWLCSSLHHPRSRLVSQPLLLDEAIQATGG